MSSFDSIICIAALVFGLFYSLNGYKKDAAKSYRHFLYAFALSIIATMISASMRGKAPMRANICAFISLVCVMALAYTKDIGKTRSYAFALVALASSVINLAGQLIRSGLTYKGLLVTLSEFIQNFSRLLHITLTNQQFIFHRGLQNDIGNEESGSFSFQNDLLDIHFYSSFLVSYLYNTNKISAVDRFNLQIALSELLNNALEHGNLEISYEEKTKWMEENGEIISRFNPLYFFSAPQICALTASSSAFSSLRRRSASVSGLSNAFRLLTYASFASRTLMTITSSDFS